MNVTVKWFDNQFNVHLASKEGAEPFLEIKGCRIVDGKNGAFVSWPAKKNEQTGKYWNHVYASEKFAAVVLATAQESMPKPAPRARQADRDDPDGDIPFANPLRGVRALVQ
jgi:DNA-binding cell septation regulator SpoVG